MQIFDIIAIARQVSYKVIWKMLLLWDFQKTIYLDITFRSCLCYEYVE